jgi:hypothetical protein
MQHRARHRLGNKLETIPAGQEAWVPKPVHATGALDVDMAQLGDGLRENFGAIGWALTPDQVQRLDKASRVIPTYPYWHQEEFSERNPFPV